MKNDPTSVRMVAEGAVSERIWCEAFRLDPGKAHEQHQKVAVPNLPSTSLSPHFVHPRDNRGHDAREIIEYPLNKLLRGEQGVFYIQPVSSFRDGAQPVSFSGERIGCQPPGRTCQPYQAGSPKHQPVQRRNAFHNKSYFKLHTARVVRPFAADLKGSTSTIRFYLYNKVKALPL